MTKFPLVSIIIVNWNGGQLFADCLASLTKLDYPSWELIVVDNGSTDGSEALAQSYQLSVTPGLAKRSGAGSYQLIKNRKNLGFAPANNQGYRVSHGHYILLLNNDTKTTPDFLTQLVARAQQDESIGVIQPKIYLMDKPGFLDNAGSFLTRTGFSVHWGFMQKDSPEFRQEAEIFSAKGACMLIRREVIEKVGLFDNEFVSYFEESDFCWRVWLAGYKVLYYPKAKIFHKLGATSKKMEQTSLQYHNTKNRITALIKNLEAQNFLLILVPHVLIVLTLGVYYLVRFQFETAWIFFAAIWWNLFHLPAISRKRTRAQKIREKPDRELFRSILRPTNWPAMLGHFRRVEAELGGREKFEINIPIKGRVKACLELLRKAGIKNKVIIDVGSSFGWLEKEIEGEGAKKIIGVEPNPEAVEFASRHVARAEFIKGKAEKLPLASGVADRVAFFDVLEHLPKGQELVALGEIRRVLKKGGRLLLSTPNSHPLANLLDPVWYFGHRHYSLGQVREFLEKSGFRITSERTRGGLPSLFYMIWFYLTKWLFGKPHPRHEFLEELDERSYNQQRGFVVHLVVARKGTND